MRSWDDATFNEHLGSRTNWGLVMGGPLSGKSLVAKIISDNTKGKVIDMIKMAELIKPRLDTEEGPFEGRVPDAEVEKDVLAMINADASSGEKFFYFFDGRYHQTIEAQAEFLLKNFGTPACIITCYADDKDVQNRFKEKNEITEDIGEEDLNNLKT